MLIIRKSDLEMYQRDRDNRTLLRLIRFAIAFIILEILMDNDLDDPSVVLVVVYQKIPN